MLRAHAVALAGLVALTAPALAQSRKYENATHGFRLKVPRALVEVPVDPHERQMLAKFNGPLKRGERADHTLLVVRIARGSGPTTGDGDVDDEKPKSLAEQAVADLNSATTLEEFLKKRNWKSDLKYPEGKVKSLTTADGHAVVVREWRNTNAQIGIRTYMVETPGEFFGVIALGAWNRTWERWVHAAVKSLERVSIATDAGGDETGEGLLGADYRHRVRSKLPEGWKAYDTDHFILVSNVKSSTVIKKMLTDLEIMRGAYLDRFPPVQEVDAVSTVRVFASYDEYMAYGAPPGSLGYWAFVDEELVLFDPGKKVRKRSAWLKGIDSYAILYHEAMHQYMHYSNGNLAPASWFGEGFGEVFGGAELDRRKGVVKKIGLNKGRMPHIREARKVEAWPDLRTFVKMTQPRFYGASVYQNYAFAWAFCYFLEQQRTERKGNPEWAALPEKYLASLREVTDEYRERVPDDAPNDWIVRWQFPIQEEAFKRAFADVDWTAIENAWIKEMKTWR